MTQIKRNILNIINNGSVVQSISITDSTTAQEIATAALITITEAQNILNSRIIDDLNNYCCDGILPTIMQPQYAFNTDTHILSITPVVNNSDGNNSITIYNENSTLIDTFSGLGPFDLTDPIQFNTNFPHTRVIDINIAATNCAGTIDNDYSLSILPDFVFGNAGNPTRGGLNKFSNLVPDSNFSTNFPAGDTVELRYFINNIEVLDTRTVFQSINNIINFTQPISYTNSVVSLYPTKLQLKNLANNFIFEFGNDLSYIFTI